MMWLVTPDQFGTAVTAIARGKGVGRVYTHAVNAPSLQDLAAKFLHFQ